MKEAKDLCKTLSQTSNFLHYLVSICERIGKCCKKQKVYDAAIENFEEAGSKFAKILAKALSRSSKEKVMFKMAQISRATGICMRFSNLLLKSNENFNLAINSLEKLPSKPNYVVERAFILKNISLNFKYLQNFQTATRYFIESNTDYLALPVSENMVFESAFNWKNSGICSTYLKNIREAETRFRKALEIYKRLPDREIYRRRITSVRRKIIQNTYSLQNHQYFHQY